MTTMESTVSEDGTFEKSNIYVSRTGEYSDEINGRWNTIASRMNGDKNGKYAIAWRFDNLTPGGKVRLYLDDFNVSKLNCGDNYPRYVYMRGTSMSTPYVTAAAGLLALYDPNADALERVQDLLCSTRPVDSLNGKVKTGGVLDLSRLDSVRPCVLDSVLNAETGELTLTGRNLTGIKDYTSDSFADVKTKSHTDTEMILDVSDYERAFMNLSFYDEEGALVYKATDFCPSGIIPETAATVPRQSTDSFENNVFTIGGKFYSYDSGGYIYELNETDGWTLFDGSGFPETEDAQPGVVRTEAADGNKLYVSVAYRMSGKTASQIVCYDFENRTWTNCGFPKEVTSCTAFTAGDNKLWFIGEQADEQYNRLIVCSYDPNTQETVHISETPFFSMEPHCFWIQSKLVVSVDTMVNPFTEKTVPQAIYDPETDSWQICEPITSEPMQKLYYSDENYLYPFVNAANSRYLVYAGVGIQGAGDIILYDTLENRFLSTSYSIYDLSQQYYCQIAADEENLYILSADEKEVGQTYDSEFDLQVMSVSFEELAASSRSIIKSGDADEDGGISLSDASLILAAYAKKSAGLCDGLTGSQRRMADVSGDGIIGMDDATFVLSDYAKKSAGLDK